MLRYKAGFLEDGYCDICGERGEAIVIQMGDSNRKYCIERAYCLLCVSLDWWFPAFFEALNDSATKRQVGAIIANRTGERHYEN